MQLRRAVAADQERDPGFLDRFHLTPIASRLVLSPIGALLSARGYPTLRALRAFRSTKFLAREDDRCEVKAV